MEITYIQKNALSGIGTALRNQWEKARRARKPAEDKWLKNVRQYRGIYDPEIEALMEVSQSKAYPKMTRWKVVATVARLMAMLFPQQDKNWELKPSPIADLPVATLQAFLDKRAAQFPPASKEDPKWSREEVAKDVQMEAARLAKNMTLKVDDDLQELDYPALVRKVIFSATVFGIGIMKGPTVRTDSITEWDFDSTGRPVASSKTVYKPVLEFVPPWNYYPDMTATSLTHQEGEFERYVMTREQVQDMADDPYYIGANIHEWLKQNPEGNHKLLEWEQTMWSDKKSDRNQAYANNMTGKIELICFVGSMKAEDMRMAGQEVPDSMNGHVVKALVWMIDSTIIKADLLPKELTKAKLHHTFLFEDDDLSLLGNGLADILRDSQLSLCEAVRCLLDESSVLGTDLEVNVSKLMSGSNVHRAKNKVWLRDDEGAGASQPAVRGIPTGNNLQQILAMVQLFIDTADKESSLPPVTMGDVSQGGSEALRTSDNMSMALGSASLPIRDTVRNFDMFTVSLVTSIVLWNGKYAPDPDRDGDSNVLARGSTSLIAKEVLANSLDQLRATVTPDEAVHVDERKLFQKRMQARDLPVDEVMVSEEEAKRRQDAQQQKMQEQQDLANREVEAKVRALLAKAFKDVAAGKAENASITLDTFNAIADKLQNDEANQQAGRTQAAA